MTNKEFYKEEFTIHLTIDGTKYEEVEVKVSNPHKTIREQIQSIINVFELPQLDSCGNPIQYLLGEMLDDGEEPIVLDFEDEDGHEQSLIDYKIPCGANLHLIPGLVAYACPVPFKMERKWLQSCKQNDY